VLEVSLRPFRLSVLAIMAATPVFAQGLANPDLSAIAVDTTTLSPGAWESSLEPDRATFVCFGCTGDPVIDIQIGRQDDGTEGRIRSGETTFADMEALCQARDPACALRGLDVAPAVGWATEYMIGDQAAQTIAVLRDGDLLTIRVLSTDAVVTVQNVDALLAGVVPQIVGD
jgi:hypothetical protein